MNISTINNNIYKNISYKDFMKNRKGQLVIKDLKSLRTVKPIPQMDSFSSYGIR